VVVNAGGGGTLTLTLQVADATGCLGSCSKVVTIEDLEPPQISCPGNLTVNSATGGCVSNVTFSVSTSDNCTVTNVTSVPPSGFAFPVGTTTVTNTARDSSGNSSRCTFTVTVVDTQPPVLNNLPVPAVSVQCPTEVPSVPTVTAADNCDGVVTTTYTLTESGGPCNRVITRTWSAIDTSSNLASFTQTITIHDDTNPVLTMGTIASSYTSVAEAEAAALAATAAIDNCGNVTKTANTVGGCAAVITVTGTDDCGNHGSVSYSTCITGVIELAIALNGTNVTVSWPFPSTGYILESTKSSGMINWKPAVEAAVTNGGRLEVTVPAGPLERYFRLHKP